MIFRLQNWFITVNALMFKRLKIWVPFIQIWKSKALRVLCSLDSSFKREHMSQDDLFWRNNWGTLQGKRHSYQIQPGSFGDFKQRPDHYTYQVSVYLRSISILIIILSILIFKYWYWYFLFQKRTEILILKYWFSHQHQYFSINF